MRDLAISKIIMGWMVIRLDSCKRLGGWLTTSVFDITTISSVAGLWTSRQLVGLGGLILVYCVPTMTQIDGALIYLDLAWKLAWSIDITSTETNILAFILLLLPYFWRRTRK